MQLFQKNFYPVLRLAIPLALTGILESLVFFFETLFLAHLGSNQLAAGALVSWLLGTFTVILFGVLSAINILVAQKHGANDKEGVGIILRDGLCLAMIFVIPAALLFWKIPTLFLSTGQSPEVVLLATPYLHALIWGLLPELLMIALLEFLIGLGHTKLVLGFSILSSILTIGLSYALIFGLGWFPKLGIAGAGWATSISYWISGVGLLIYILNQKSYQTYVKHLMSPQKPAFLLELLYLGTPMGLMYCIEVGFFFVQTLIMGTQDRLFLAANQIALQYFGTLMAIIFAIAQAITVRMGHMLGQGKVNAAQRSALAGMVISILFMLIVAGCYWSFPSTLISIDLNPLDPDKAQIVHYATQFLGICALFQVIESARVALFGALRGLKDTQFTLFISLLSFWGIALPVGFFLTTHTTLEGRGLWWGSILGVTLSVPVLYWRFKCRIRDYSSIVEIG